MIWMVKLRVGKYHVTKKKPYAKTKFHLHIIFSYVENGHKKAKIWGRLCG